MDLNLPTTFIPTPIARATLAALTCPTGWLAQGCNRTPPLSLLVQPEVVASDCVSKLREQRAYGEVRAMATFQLGRVEILI